MDDARARKETREAGVTQDPDGIRPGYVRTEVGIIPEDWDAVRMGRLANVVRGASPRPINSPKWFDEQSKIGWLRIADVTATVKYLDTTSQNLSEAGISNSRFVGRGSLVMSICATVGRPIITRKDVCIHDGFVALNNLNTDKEYLYYVLSHLEPDWSRHGQTGSQMNLNTGLISSTSVPLPSPTEQRAIAAVLSDVDELIGALQVLIAKKRAIKQAAMQQLLTGRTRLPGFEGEWETRRLGDLGTFTKGKGITRGDLRETGARCIRYGELYTRYENYVAEPESRIPQEVTDVALPVTKGNLLFAGSGETADEIGICVAYVGDEPAYAGGDIIVLRQSGQNPVFLAHLLNAPVAARQKTRMAQGDAIVHIRGDHLAEVELRLPALPEQQAIATVLSDMDTEIAALERRLDKTRSIKQGMMQQLLTGSIRLPVPDDATEGDAYGT